MGFSNRSNGGVIIIHQSLQQGVALYDTLQEGNTGNTTGHGVIVTF
jgi:hypothetical protein